MHSAAAKGLNAVPALPRWTCIVSTVGLNGSRLPRHLRLGATLGHGEVHAQRGERPAHVLDVVAHEEITHARGPTSQCGEKQRPIRKALRAGERHVALGAVHGFQLECGHGVILTLIRR